MKIAMFISGKKEKFPLTILAGLAKENIKVGLIIYKKQFSLVQTKKYFKRKGFIELIKHAFLKSFTKSHDELIDTYFEDFIKKEKLELKPIKAYNIPIKSVTHLNDSFELLKEYNPDIIIHAGGGLIDKKIITIPSHGILNCHPASLPKYPGESGHKIAFDNGEAGVTIHYIDEGIDTGPIITVKEFEPSDTILNTKNKSMAYGAGIIIDVVKNEYKKIHP